MKNLNFKKGDGLVPAIIQDATTRQVLMLGFMNAEALQKTITEKKVIFWSRTKKRLWQKGEESGNFLELVDIKTDCDNDTLLVTATPVGPTCHTGTQSCFGDNVFGLEELYQTMQARAQTMPEGSYTAFLLKKGLKKICAKVKEESAEVIKAAKQETKQRLIEESVDVLYHLFVLLVSKKVILADLYKEMAKRQKKIVDKQNDEF